MERKFVSKNGCKDFIPKYVSLPKMTIKQAVNVSNVIKRKFEYQCARYPVCEMYDKETCDMMTEVIVK